MTHSSLLARGHRSWLFVGGLPFLTSQVPHGAAWVFLRCSCWLSPGRVAWETERLRERELENTLHVLISAGTCYGFFCALLITQAEPGTVRGETTQGPIQRSGNYMGQFWGFAAKISLMFLSSRIRCGPLWIPPFSIIWVIFYRSIVDLQCCVSFRYSKVIQSYVHMNIFSDIFLLQVIAKYWV